MNLFIDTNIYLNFYNLSKDDINELKKVQVLLEDNEITIYLPKQTENEFYRNREKIISEAINHLKTQKVSSISPQISKDYDQYNDLLQAYKNYESAKNKIINQIISDAKEFTLNADKLILKIFDLCRKINSSEIIEQKAKNRYDLGNPPGKGNSYGDAVNWVSLIEECKSEEDIYIISDDGDYHSLLDKQNIHYYLKKEWNSLKKSNIYYYSSLTQFFKAKFPHINLVDEYKKDILINKLMNAKSFAEAKINLAKLYNYKEFTNQQLNDILNISTTNNQLFWVKNDYGVGNFLREMIKGKEQSLDQKILEDFNNIYRPEPAKIISDSDDLPW